MNKKALVLGALAIAGGSVAVWLLRRKPVVAPPKLRPTHVVPASELTGSSRPGSPTNAQAVAMTARRIDEAFVAKAAQLEDVRQSASEAGDIDTAKTVNKAQQDLEQERLNTAVYLESLKSLPAETAPAPTPPPVAPVPVARMAAPVAPPEAPGPSVPARPTTVLLPVLVPGESGTLREGAPSPSYLLSRTLPAIAQPIISAVSGRFTLPSGGSWTLEGVYTQGVPTEGPVKSVFVHWQNSATNTSAWFELPYDVSEAFAAAERAQDAPEAPGRTAAETVVQRAVDTLVVDYADALKAQGWLPYNGQGNHRAGDNPALSRELLNGVLSTLGTTASDMRVAAKVYFVTDNNGVWRHVLCISRADGGPDVWLLNHSMTAAVPSSWVAAQRAVLQSTATPALTAARVSQPLPTATVVGPAVRTAR